jgi:hypothetical protein
MSMDEIVKKQINQENDSKKNSNSKKEPNLKIKFKNQMTMYEIKNKIQLKIINVNKKNCK